MLKTFDTKCKLKVLTTSTAIQLNPHADMAVPTSWPDSYKPCHNSTNIILDKGSPVPITLEVLWRKEQTN